MTLDPFNRFLLDYLAECNKTNRSTVHRWALDIARKELLVRCGKTEDEVMAAFNASKPAV